MNSTTLDFITTILLLIWLCFLSYRITKLEDGLYLTDTINYIQQDTISRIIDDN